VDFRLNRDLLADGCHQVLSNVPNLLQVGSRKHQRAGCIERISEMVQAVYSLVLLTGFLR